MDRADNRKRWARKWPRLLADKKLKIGNMHVWMEQQDMQVGAVDMRVYGGSCVHVGISIVHLCQVSLVTERGHVFVNVCLCSLLSFSLLRSVPAG